MKGGGGFGNLEVEHILWLLSQVVNMRKRICPAICLSQYVYIYQKCFAGYNITASYG